MRWKGRRQSANIEDRRGMGGGGLMVGGGAIGLVLLLVYVFMGGDPAALQSGGGQPRTGTYQESAEEKQRREFVSVILADTEEVWKEIFRGMGRTYREPTLVLFSDSVSGACGYASAAVGPFYCPEDQKICIDLGFYDVLRDRFGAGGDFAQAYVIAHEVGHHVQNLMGTMSQVQSQRQRLSERAYNDLSARLELQADFYAGVWAHHAARMADLDERDIREAVEAASAIGDDAIQAKTQGQIVPDAFTHGTSDQRVRWFLRGWKTGDLRQGDTFTSRRL